MLRAEEVAEAVLYLAHPAARSTVGTVLTVDGGLASLRLFSS
jgi:NAD(P)-dependent dehydrogenase (short-subunit alcohol dehydrogenase family)